MVKMNLSLIFLRLLFVLLSTVFMTVYMVSIPEGKTITHALWGIATGLLFGFFLILSDILFRRFNLRAFNVAVLGIFIGYLMGKALLLLFGVILDISSVSLHLSSHLLEMIKIAIFLFGVYLGTLMTLRSSDELYISIPFVRLTSAAQKRKDCIIDSSLLLDPRIIDLAATGLLDHQLILPKFIVKELYAQSEIGTEASKARAKKALEVVKKLESIPNLEMRYNDTDFPEVEDMQGKLICLARLLDSNVLSSDPNRAQTSKVEEISIINLHTLSNALKPLMSSGETFKIEVQRYGKEPRQGIGYLKDGTMVVINQGGDFIGSTVEVRVLSVKHTSSGRIIFCNVANHDDSALPPSEGFDKE